jgi:epoxyqueuosine reductase
VFIAIGNSGDTGFVPLVRARLEDPSPLVRGAAVWALGALDRDAAEAARDVREGETDPTVLEEWHEIGP